MRQSPVTDRPVGANEIRHSTCNVVPKQAPHPESLMAPQRVNRARRIALIRLLNTNPMLTEAEARIELGLPPGEWRDSPSDPPDDDPPPAGEGAMRKPGTKPGSPLLKSAG